MPNSARRLFRSWEGLITVTLCLLAITGVGVAALNYTSRDDASTLQGMEQRDQTPPAPVEKKVAPINLEPESVIQSLPEPTPPPAPASANPPQPTCDTVKRALFDQQKTEKIEMSERVYSRMQSFTRYYFYNRNDSSAERDKRAQHYKQEHEDRLKSYEAEYIAQLQSIGCI